MVVLRRYGDPSHWVVIASTGRSRQSQECEPREQFEQEAAKTWLVRGVFTGPPTSAAVRTLAP